jgi:NADH-quinone oxidoreductase subunit M
MIMMLGSVGLPGTTGFVGEFLVMVGAWQANILVAIFTATGIVLGATYMLWLYRRVVFGRAEKDEILSLEPLNQREIFIFVPLTILVIWYGIFPSGILEIMDVSIMTVLDQMDLASMELSGNSQIATTGIGE